MPIRRDARGRFAGGGGGGGKGRPTKGGRKQSSPSGLQWGKKQDAMYMNPSDARSDRRHFAKQMRELDAKKSAAQKELKALKEKPARQRQKLQQLEGKLKQAQQRRADAKKAVDAANAKLAETRTRKAAAASKRGASKPPPPAWSPAMAAAAGRKRGRRS